MKTKRSIPLLPLLLLSFYAQSQVRLPVNNGIRTATEKVLSAYPDHFVGIRGDSIGAINNVVIFESKVIPDGALNCSILKYEQTRGGEYAWQAVLLKTEDYAAAVKKYNACYQQLKNVALKRGAQSWKFDGDYSRPDDVKSFFSTILRPVGNEEVLGKLRLEILMESDTLEWTIKIMVYDRDREDWQGSLGE